MFALLYSYTDIPNQTNRVLKSTEGATKYNSLNEVEEEINKHKNNTFMTGHTTITILQDRFKEGWKVIDVVSINHDA